MGERNAYRKRIVKEPPHLDLFKPVGASMRTAKKIIMNLDELEALRFADYRQLAHLEASQKMNISRPTFTRLINKARHKLSQVLLEGCVLKIEGGNVEFRGTVHQCQDCGESSKQSVEAPLEECPECGSPHTENLANRHRKTEKNETKEI